MVIFSSQMENQVLVFEKNLISKTTKKKKGEKTTRFLAGPIRLIKKKNLKYTPHICAPVQKLPFPSCPHELNHLHFRIQSCYSSFFPFHTSSNPSFHFTFTFFTSCSLYVVCALVHTPFIQKHNVSSVVEERKENREQPQKEKRERPKPLVCGGCMRGCRTFVFVQTLFSIVFNERQREREREERSTCRPPL